MYEYVGSDPVSFTDPLGLFWVPNIFGLSNLIPDLLQVLQGAPSDDPMIVLASDGGNEGGDEKDTEGGDDDDDGPQTAGSGPGRVMPTELENFVTVHAINVVGVLPSVCCEIVCMRYWKSERSC